MSESITVRDSAGGVLEAQLLPLSDTHVSLRNYHVKAYLGQTPSKTPKYWLAFTASVPPLGFSTYTISSARSKGVVELSFKFNNKKWHFLTFNFYNSFGY